MIQSMKKIGVTLALAMATCTAATVIVPITAMAKASTSTTMTRSEAVALAQKQVKGTVIEIEADWDDGVLNYDIKILDSSNVEHDLEINTATKKVKEKSKETYRKTKAQKLRSAKITHDKAIAVAAKQSGATTFKSSEMDVNGSQLIYEVTLKNSKGKEVEVWVDALTGKVVDTDIDD